MRVERCFQVAMHASEYRLQRVKHAGRLVAAAKQRDMATLGCDQFAQRGSAYLCPGPTQRAAPFNPLRCG